MTERFVLYSRSGCGLCEEMHEELAAALASGDCTIDVLDVDADRAARVRFGHKVPVLLLDGEIVCHGRLDRAELDKAVAHHRRTV